VVLALELNPGTNRMSDEKALLAAIYANPLDDAPRLVYADWLDERGGAANSARAEFIRVQCELALLPAYDPRVPALQARQTELLAAHRARWLRPLKQYRSDALFARGFPVPGLDKLDRDDIVRLTEKDLRAAPLWRYSHDLYGAELKGVLDWPHLHRLTTLSLCPPLPRNWVKRIAQCPGLRNLTELGFTRCPLTAAKLETILDAWVGRRLTALWVNECPVGDAGARVIANHPATAGLRLLRAHTARLTSRGIKALVDSPNLDRVTLATFAHNRIGDTGAGHLLRWKALPGMTELYLMNTGISEKVGAGFLGRPGLLVRLGRPN
jgi:uncharacterized protein (TIGR02996 family)